MGVPLFVCVVFLNSFIFGFVSGAEIVLTNSVEFIQIQPAQTPSMTLHCGLKDMDQVQFPFTTRQNRNVHPWSMMISRDGVVLASITQFTPAKAIMDLDKVWATGSLSGKGTESGYLELIWHSPDQTQGGTYTCEIVGVGVSGQNFNFRKSLTIPALSLMKLATKVSSLELQNQGLQSELSKLTLVNSQLQTSNANLSRAIGDLQNHVTQLTNVQTDHVETGEVTCDHTWTGSDGNFSTKTMTVHFKSSYLRSPDVLLSVTEVKDSTSATHAYQARLVQVYTDRFTFTCGQGRGVGPLVVSWISVAA